VVAARVRSPVRALAAAAERRTPGPSRPRNSRAPTWPAACCGRSSPDRRSPRPHLAEPAVLVL